jgi:hypothetical protein
VAYLLFPLELYAPIGVYEVTATQGSTVMTATFNVSQPPVGLLRIRPPTSGSPGDEFVLQLAGLPPGAPVSVDIYTQQNVFTYVMSITSPATDSSGRAEYLLSTSPSDPPGVYCFVIRGSENPSCSTGEVVKLD